MFIFCDASKSSFGFVVYAVQNGNSRFLFSKLKIAPLVDRTLPTLELLAIYLALKHLESYIDEVYNSDIKFNSFTFLSDSQVALSWILKGYALKKNVFINNRLKDMKTILETFHRRNILINFDLCPNGRKCGRLFD